MFIIAFVVGVCLLQRQAELPAVWPLALLAAAAGYAACRLAAARPALIMLSALLVGFSFADWRAQMRMAEQLAAADEARTLVVIGTVTDLVESTRFGARFRFHIEKSDTPLPATVLLSDGYRPAAGSTASDWQPGQRWRLSVRLKRPHGNLNPGSFDYESWLLAEGIGATGNLARGEREQLKDFVPTAGNLIDRARSRLAARIRAQLGEQAFAGVVVALVVGDQTGISQLQWDLFRNTGITHLVSISGLHVTLIAGLFGSLSGWLWRRSFRLTSLLPARAAAVLAGVAAAFAYTLLAGFAVPTQRTFFMVSAAAIALLSGRRLSAASVWAFALGVTVALDTWAVLSLGFWLSYLTVGAMLFALSPRLGKPHALRDRLWLWGGAQWAATLGSMPLLIWLFQQLPLASPLANAVAIPLVSTVATPLALLGSLDPSGLVLRLSHSVLAFTFSLIGPLADVRSVWQQATPPVWSLPIAMLAVALLLLPGGIPGRWLAWVGLLPLLLPLQPQHSREGEFKATIFDVGQGLAILVTAGDQHLLFDAGPAGQGGRVLPGALRAAGVGKLDLLILSHDDPNHTGGALAVMGSTKVTQLLGAAPQAPFGYSPVERLPPASPCHAGMAWSWNQVRFELLNPPADRPLDSSEKDSGCVLKVSSEYGSLLLPADISPARERALLEDQAQALRADVMVLPNHGAKGSSSSDFVAAVAPKAAVATVAYLNPFHHPRADIVARYAAAGIAVWRTDLDGAVSVNFTATGMQIGRQRQLTRRYWHAQNRTAD